MRIVRTVLIGLVAASCASSGGQEGPARRRDTITTEEIAGLQVTSGYEVVQQLRPEYLRTRGVQSMQSASTQMAVVYVDGVRQGGPDALRQIPRESIQEIRYLNGSDATTQYGTGHGGGAILVRTRR
jgi:outer membrane receptor protein involved in Fe transport